VRRTNLYKSAIVNNVIVFTSSTVFRDADADTWEPELELSHINSMMILWWCGSPTNDKNRSQYRWNNTAGIARNVHVPAIQMIHWRGFPRIPECTWQILLFLLYRVFDGRMDQMTATTDRHRRDRCGIHLLLPFACSLVVVSATLEEVEAEAVVDVRRNKKQ
jgi:hypothetical protein